jgi:hypothetical protein
MPESPSPFEGSELSAPETLRRMIMGYVSSQSVYVAAKLGIADLLVGGPRDVDSLAAATGAHTESLYRVLRLLAGVGVFTESTERMFGLNDLGACLQSGVPGSMRGAAMLFGEEPFRACAELLHTVRTGETAFDHVYGASHFAYLADHPESADTFHDGMRQMTGVVQEALVSAYDFSTARVLVDVGAGQGGLLAAILKAHPALHGVLFETPVVVPEARQLIEGEDLAERCKIIAGDACGAVPAGGDTYLLKSVIHCFDDATATRILRNCRTVIPPDGTILLIERVVPEGNEPLFPKLNDVVMLAVSGGAERTQAEYGALYDTAGFVLTRVIPTPSGFSVIEGKPRIPAPSL